MFANTPPPPYYAVIFTSARTEGDNGYDQMAAHMVTLAQEQPGFLGLESARNTIGITISYWSSLDAIQAWKEHSAHLFAQKEGKRIWYSAFKLRICKVEREQEFFKEL